MENIKVVLQTYILTFAAVYLFIACALSFVRISLEPFNIVEWGEFLRGLYLILCISIGTIIYAGYCDEEYDKEMKKY